MTVCLVGLTGAVAESVAAKVGSTDVDMVAESEAATVRLSSRGSIVVDMVAESAGLTVPLSAGSTAAVPESVVAMTVRWMLGSTDVVAWLLGRRRSRRIGGGKRGQREAACPSPLRPPGPCVADPRGL